MSPLNISARPFRFTLNGGDWTDFVSAEGISVNMAEYEVFSGLNLVTARLSLIIPLNGVGIPSSANPRLNRGYWGRGALGTIAMSGGGLTTLPFSGNAFYLLRSPQQPYQNSPSDPLKLDLEFGCKLSLENFSEPININITGLKTDANVVISRAAVVKNILSSRGLGSAIPDLGYQLDFPVASITNSETPIQLAGAIAAAAGYALRCDSEGLVVADEVERKPGIFTALSYSQTGEVKAFTPSGNLSEQPVEKLIIEGIWNKVCLLYTSPSPRD